MITAELLDAIVQIVDHYIDDERRDFESRTQDADPAEHIYDALQLVQEWIDLFLLPGRRR